ncbi:NAD(P)/FAD-dependent oxidoreductase [Mycolicibacterium sp. 018/SC-01/001]|uniref:NAD(P)/FAD-dependent oxidoreductase n=1 Tax=Mycolicibacterium sp. 018/SC-01/001 TaxID=2592069 RepID=UPI00117F3AFB|nr:NAD(P)/FAD-dependent oxidoreductase [Mycolicibacterium sp. 018/SC-01/001]TRW88250.1 NAD(P)/FAD-dependent oxidoreductase [Mycolicibacterium sp. 018/SC-01/001]
MTEQWDCVVIGGGAAGLSAALMLGRARRRTLVVDAGAQSNRAAHGIGGLLGFDGVPPAQVYAHGRDELTRYPSVQVRDDEVTVVTPHEGGFTVALAGGGTAEVRRVLLAMGMHYEIPGIEGLEAYWGAAVFHCPFCHGWEMRDQPLGVVAQGERAVHLASLLRSWTDDIVVMSHGPAELADAQRALLAGYGIAVDERTIASVEGADGQLDAVVFDDGSLVHRRGLLVATTLRQRSGLAQALGVAFASPGPVAAETIAVDALSQTSVPGVFAAGDVSAQMYQVAAAVASGSAAAASIVRSLMEELL